MYRMHGKYSIIKKVSEAQICKFYFFSFERKYLITSSLVIFKYCLFFQMIICSSNISGPNLFFFAAVAIPQFEKHRSDGVEAAGTLSHFLAKNARIGNRILWSLQSKSLQSFKSKMLSPVIQVKNCKDRRRTCRRSPEEVKNNGHLMWSAEETAGSKDLRSVYGPLPGPDRPQISLLKTV